MAITATMAEAQNDYYKAMRAGKREGEILPNLDDILKEKNIVSVREVPLGLVQIPSELIVGTKTAGRSSAFSKSFKPLLKENTEFAYKWMALYKAHLNEGIREPIKAYEFMNKFYVEEGNKRVSVLKFFDAVSIPGNVTRIVPPRTEEKENKIYYEFMDFYALSRINYIWFTQLGSFAKLQRLVGKRPDEAWSDDDRLDFASAYNRFRAEYKANGGDKIPITTGDAFLYFIGLYDYRSLDDMTAVELKEQLAKSWDEFRLLTTDESVELQMDPTAESEVKKNFFARLIPTSTPKLLVAFIHDHAESLRFRFAGDERLNAGEILRDTRFLHRGVQIIRQTVTDDDEVSQRREALEHLPDAGEQALPFIDKGQLHALSCFKVGLGHIVRDAQHLHGLLIGRPIALRHFGVRFRRQSQLLQRLPDMRDTQRHTVRQRAVPVKINRRSPIHHPRSRACPNKLHKDLLPSYREILGERPLL